MRMPIVVIVAGAALFVVTPALAHGRDLIQIDFDGAVTQPGWTWGVMLEAGDPLHARVVFDSEAPDYDSSPLVGRFQYEFMEVFTTRGLVFRSGQSPPGSLHALTIDRAREEFRVVGGTAVHDENVVSVLFPPGTFASDRPPMSLPFGAATEANYTFRFFFTDLSGARLTQYRDAVVPEPWCGVAAGLAVGFCAHARRRRR